MRAHFQAEGSTLSGKVLLDCRVLWMHASASKTYPRLVSPTLNEVRENAVDELNITKDDSDGSVVIPRKGVKITLQLGRQHSGMEDKGAFVVDEVEHEGAPDMLVLPARSAEMAKPVRTRKDRSFDQKTVADIVGLIAKDNGFPPQR
ncbi:hypothetical protein ACO0LD_06715 [Undibacterium sp. Ji83W]|uniref:hypothetical protein n=1 Tax=Undibacterium sp. Ji83W TaxID=3413043 RepID=UPI003BF1FF26